MTNEEINKLIAESLGWKLKWKSCPNWLSPFGERFVSPPNYAESLDACAEFEKMLGLRELADYSYKLMDITNTTYEAMTATAAKRCEAYLRMKGLWK